MSGRLNFRLIRNFCAGCIVVLVSLSTLGQVMVYGFGKGSVLGFVDKFWLDAEGNFPTFFSTMLLLAVAVAAWAAGKASRQRADGWWRHWYVIAILFLIIGIDETTQVRERIDDESYRVVQMSGFFTFQWVIAGSILVAGLVAWFYRFVFALPRAIRMQVIIAAALYLGGALGMEMVGGKVFEAQGFSQANVPYVVCATIEETLEMIGALVCLDAFVRYLTQYSGVRSVNLSVTSK